MKRRYLWYLLGLYFLFVLVKSLLSYFTVTPSMFNDEYFFAKMAKSFFYNLNLYVHGNPLPWGRPLYPMLISISYLFNKMSNVYLSMKIINCFLSSLVIFPAYLLAKEFFSRKKSLLIAVLVSVLPINFAFSSYIMSENIFYVLFLFSIYFIYKALNEDKIKWVIFSGLFIGLCSLSKVHGLILFPLLVLFLFKKRFKAGFNILLISLAVIAPYYLINGAYYGFTLKGLFGYAPVLGRKLPFSLVSFVYWGMIYLGYLILASGVFPFLTKFKKESFLWIMFLSIFLLIAVAAYHSSTKPFSTRPLGRYVDAVIPLILIYGFYNLKQNKSCSLFKGGLVFILYLFSIKLLDFSLFPVNFLMISHLGIINTLFGKVIGSLFILGIFPVSLLLRKINIKKLIILTSVIFLAISLLCYGINFYSAYNRWYSLDQTQAGLWINEFDKNPNKIVFVEKLDDVSELPREQPILRAGFWIEGEIIHEYIDRLDSYQVDYVLSIKEIPNYRIVKEFGDIKVLVK